LSRGVSKAKVSSLRHIEATAPISQQVAVLNRFQPHALLPYPSIAALLAREQMAGRLAIRPEMVATHSELLTPEMARLIEQAWGRKPFNHYGLTEEPHIGTDCALHTGIHLFEDTSMIEVVNDDYQPVPDGTTGTRYLLTNPGPNASDRTGAVYQYSKDGMLRKRHAADRPSVRRYQPSARRLRQRDRVVERTSNERRLPPDEAAPQRLPRLDIEPHLPRRSAR
jgi:hypothetical protein